MIKYEEMTGKERIKAAIKFREHDRVSCFPLIHWGSAGIYGTSVEEYAKDPLVQAESLIKCCDIFGYDGINTGVDVIIEAEAFGGETVFQKEGPPFLKSHFIYNDSEKLTVLKSLKVLDPRSSGRMPIQIKASEEVVKRKGKEKYIMAFIMGPLNAASQLRGVQNTMIDFILDPAYIEELLDFSTKQVLEYGKSLAETGVDCIGIGEALASPNFSSPESIYKFDFPRLVKLINGLHEAEVDTILHICGDLYPMFKYSKKIGVNILKETGTDIIDIDHQVKMDDAIKETKVCCRGNLDPSTVLLSGTKEVVFEYSKEVILNAGPTNGAILGSGCDMSYRTPKENIMAMMEAIQQYGNYPLNK
ncbi:MAG: uroporphyrinogen decarboxylase family protein [Actinobacteria bacterium]|nr:uroporphyrinogen decarboxylase family protein [Actinomycetota bacterium]